MLWLLAMILLCGATGLALWHNRRSGAGLFAGSVTWVGIVCIAACALNVALVTCGDRWLASTRRDALDVTIGDRWALADLGSVRLSAIVDRDARPLLRDPHRVETVQVRAQVMLPRIPPDLCNVIIASRLEGGECGVTAVEGDGDERTLVCSGAPGSVAQAVRSLLSGWAPTGDGPRNARASDELAEVVERVMLGDLDLSAWSIDLGAVERGTRLQDPPNLLNALFGWPAAENALMTGLAMAATAWMAIATRATLPPRGTRSSTASPTPPR